MISSNIIVWSVVLFGQAVSGPPPDITVAADGSGDFTTIQAAVASIPKDNRERMIILVKDGVYREKIRVDAPFVTLRGQSRKVTRIEFRNWRASSAAGRAIPAGRSST